VELLKQGGLVCSEEFPKGNAYNKPEDLLGEKKL